MAAVWMVEVCTKGIFGVSDEVLNSLVSICLNSERFVEDLKKLHEIILECVRMTFWRDVLTMFEIIGVEGPSCLRFLTLIRQNKENL